MSTNGAESASSLEMSLLQVGLEVQGANAHKLATMSVHEMMDETQVHKKRSALHSALPTMVACIGVPLAATLLVVVAALAYGARSAEKETPPSEAEQAKAEIVSKDTGKDEASTTSAPRADAAGGEEQKKPILWMVLFFVIGHCIAASSLTVVNKLAMDHFHPPAPPGVPATTVVDPSSGVVAGRSYVWTLVLIQFVFASCVTKLCGVCRLIKVEPLETKTALAYFPAAGMFMITIVAGNAVMNATNVNTFLILRALVPVPCALLETVIYSDPCPPLLSWMALTITMVGAGVYSLAMGGFEMKSIAWSIIFLVTMPIDGILIKHSISQSKLSAWGLVYYNNTLAALPLVFYVFLFELTSKSAISEMCTQLLLPEAKWIVLLSCFAGIAISFFQLNTRFYISATAFMILGVVNKFLTVLWSEVFLGKSGAMAVTGVLMTLGGAVIWQVIMGQASVKLRERSNNWEKMVWLPIGCVVSALVAAAWVQHSVG